MYGLQKIEILTAPAIIIYPKIDINYKKNYAPAPSPASLYKI